MDKILNTAEQERLERAFAECTWLEYFNRYLYAHQVITEREYKLMVEKIAKRCGKQRSRRA